MPMDEHNPYAAPNAVVAEPVAMHAPSGAPLFKLSGIGVATFFGTLMAGGLLMALNERALGRPERVWPTLALSFGASVVVMALAWMLPAQVPSIVFTVVQLIAITHVAKAHQGTQIDARIASGLPMCSNWRAFGISLLVLVGILALMMLGVFAVIQWNGSSWGEFLQGLAMTDVQERAPSA